MRTRNGIDIATGYRENAMQNTNTTMILDPKTLCVTIGVVDASGRWAVMVDPGKSLPGCRTLVHQARFASLATAERLATVVRGEIQTYGVRVETADILDGPAARIAWAPTNKPTMTFAGWMAALDNLANSMASVRITLAPSHIWLVDHRKELTPEQSFHEVVGQVIDDIGVRLVLAERADGVEAPPL